MKKLESIRQASKKFTLPDFLKPCVALMLGDGFDKGGDFSRDRVAYIIATELRRVGKSPEVAEKILLMWDEGNNPELNRAKIRAKVKSAFSKDFTFGCNNEPVIIEYCEKVNKDFCKYYKQIATGKRTGSDRDFISFGWVNVLSPACRLVYYVALPEIEKRRGIKAGEKLFVAHREISRVCGVDLSIIGKTLEKLGKVGLITYEAGEPYRWRVKASIIKRVIPIPRPNHRAVMSLKNQTHRKKGMSLKNQTGIVGKIKHIRKTTQESKRQRVRARTF